MIIRGDIILTHTPLKSAMDVIPWLIRKITNSHWNHVAWALGPALAVEAQGGVGVRTISTAKLMSLGEDYYCIMRIKPGYLTARRLEKALERAHESQGKIYDWWLIFQLFWLYLTGSRKCKEAGDWDNAWICSELIARPLWEAAEFVFTPRVPVGNIVPADIRKSECLQYIAGGELL
jgi:hypothetical protein